MRRRPKKEKMKLTAREVAILMQIKAQIKELSTPHWVRHLPEEALPSIEEYLKMDRTLSMMHVDPRLWPAA
jgi:hypothetical protein